MSSTVTPVPVIRSAVSKTTAGGWRYAVTKGEVLQASGVVSSWKLAVSAATLGVALVLEDARSGQRSR